ncbi:MAG: hypothetical protein SVK08_06250 [Halobacteriota archaeon]|nr:hypothetical protein [Halobacteriota archaeon]
MAGLSRNQVKLMIFLISVAVPLCMLFLLYSLSLFVVPEDYVMVEIDVIYLMTGIFLFLALINFPLLNRIKNLMLSRSYLERYPSPIGAKIIVIGVVPFFSTDLGLIIGILGILTGLGNQAILLSIPFFLLTMIQTRVQVWGKLDEMYQVEDLISEVGLFKIPLSGRTSIDFEADESIFQVVDEWADTSMFKRLESTKSMRLYRKGREKWNCPLMFKVYENNEKMHIEAWIRFNPRNPYTLILPSEIKIESGNGILMLGLRHTARKEVNKLLEMLDLPKIT